MENSDIVLHTTSAEAKDVHKQMLWHFWLKHIGLPLLHIHMAVSFLWHCFCYFPSYDLTQNVWKILWKCFGHNFRKQYMVPLSPFIFSNSVCICLSTVAIFLSLLLSSVCLCLFCLSLLLSLSLLLVPFDFQYPILSISVCPSVCLSLSGCLSICLSPSLSLVLSACLSPPALMFLVLGKFFSSQTRCTRMLKADTAEETGQFVDVQNSGALCPSNLFVWYQCLK